MRKYSALFALILVLWGTFSPFGISILNIRARQSDQRRIVSLKINTQKAFAEPTDPIPAGPSSDDSASAGAVQDQIEGGARDELTKLNSDKNDVDCSILDIFCWMYTLIIDFILFIPSGLSVISGMFMDVSLGASIDPGMYGAEAGGQIDTGLRKAWGIVRDFANIGFIFALFVIAFSLILNKDLMGLEPKKAIVRVIIMALLVNFSFLFCRIVIQTADLFSHVLYNQLSTVTVGQDGIDSEFNTHQDTEVGDGQALTTTTQISPALRIIRKVNVQKILMESGFVNTDTNPYIQGSATAIGAAYGGLQAGWQGVAAGGAAGFLFFQFKSATFYISYGILAVTCFFIFLVLIFVFISSALLFLGRIFGLWVAIIISPIAFVSHTIPALEKDPNIGFDGWMKGMVKLAFMTPIFLFFLYLALMVLDINAALVPESVKANTGLVSVLLQSLLPLAGATFIILKGKKIATEMSGQIGTMVSGISGKVTGFALGAATGGAAFMARQSLGRAGTYIANKTADKPGMGGINKLGKSMGAATFDVRNSTRLMDGFGKFTGATGATVDLGTQRLQEKGGYMAEGGFKQVWADRQDRIADEKATKAEQEALEAANNPQSMENVRKRNTERKLAAEKKRKEAEEARIALEAEDAPVTQAFVDAETAKANADIAKNNTKLGTRTELSEPAAKKLKDDLEAAEQKQKDNAAKIKDPATTAADKATLQAEQKVISADIKTMKATEKEQTEIKKLKDDNTKLTNKITALGNSVGKSAAELKHDAEIDKLKSIGTKEWKDLEAENKEIAEKGKEINKLKKEEADLRKEGKIAEADGIRAKSKKLKDDIDKSKKDGAHFKAQQAFDKKYGHVKAMEDVAKDQTKSYIKSQSARLDKFNTEIQKQEIQLVEDKFALNAKRKQVLSAQANYLDKKSEILENPAFGITKEDSRKIASVLGTISGGRIFAGAVKDANETASTNVRTSARTGK